MERETFPVSGARDLPNLVVIGAQKCGTTSLHRYLARHPDIGMSRRKELDFFTKEWDRGEAWYRSWFDSDRPVRGETSPSYSFRERFPDTARRMKALIPDARLIYVVRDPLRRTCSHYHHIVADGRENRGLADALAEDGVTSPYVVRSLYASQLEPFLEHFSPDRIQVVQSERLDAARVETLEEIFSFLGVDPSFRSVWFRRRSHRSARKRRLTEAGERLSRTAPMRAVARLPAPWGWMMEDIVYWPVSRRVEPDPIPPRTRARLLELFADDVARLRHMTGQAFEGWCV